MEEAASAHFVSCTRSFHLLQRLRNHVPLLSWLAAAAVVPMAMPAGAATKPMDAGAAKGATTAGFVPMAGEQKSAVGATAPAIAPVQPTGMTQAQPMAQPAGLTTTTQTTAAATTQATTAAPSNVNIAV